MMLGDSADKHAREIQYLKDAHAKFLMTHGRTFSKARRADKRAVVRALRSEEYPEGIRGWLRSKSSMATCWHADLPVLLWQSTKPEAGGAWSILNVRSCCSSPRFGVWPPCRGPSSFVEISASSAGFGRKQRDGSRRRLSWMFWGSDAQGHRNIPSNPRSNARSGTQTANKSGYRPLRPSTRRAFARRWQPNTRATPRCRSGGQHQSASRPLAVSTRSAGH